MLEMLRPCMPCVPLTSRGVKMLGAVKDEPNWGAPLAQRKGQSVRLFERQILEDYSYEKRKVNVDRSGADAVMHHRA
jgi:hypothetical protein